MYTRHQFFVIGREKKEKTRQKPASLKGDTILYIYIIYKHKQALSVHKTYYFHLHFQFLHYYGCIQMSIMKIKPWQRTQHVPFLSAFAKHQTKDKRWNLPYTNTWNIITKKYTNNKDFCIVIMDYVGDNILIIVKKKVKKERRKFFL